MGMISAVTLSSRRTHNIRKALFHRSANQSIFVELVGPKFMQVVAPLVYRDVQDNALESQHHV